MDGGRQRDDEPREREHAQAISSVDSATAVILMSSSSPR
jgi:hypothetical protein